MARNEFQNIYEILLSHYGPQGWWPAESTLEMMIGAVLTQNTNWKNVEKAINNLKQAEKMDFEALVELEFEDLAQLIRPAGYYNLKAKRLGNLLQMIGEEYGGELQQMVDDNLHSAREKLLGVKGVGPETADSILLYACNKPVFVVDTYTYRVFYRHDLLEEECSYEEIQERFMDSLEEDTALFNEYHALIVMVAKEYCKKTNPLCSCCPLHGI